jgi:hypothetical protein
MLSLDRIMEIANAGISSRDSPEVEEYHLAYGRLERAIERAFPSKEEARIGTEQFYGKVPTDGKQLGIAGISGVKPESTLRKLTSMPGYQIAVVNMKGQPDIDLYNQIVQKIDNKLCFKRNKNGSAKIFSVQEGLIGNINENLVKILPTKDGNHEVKVYSNFGQTKVDHDAIKVLLLYSLAKK